MIRKFIIPLLSLAVYTQSVQAAYNPFKPDAVKVINTALANANLVTVAEFDNLNTTAAVNTNTDVFTSITSNGVNCIPGTYLVDVLLYQTMTSSSRASVSVEVTVNGAGTGLLGANGYLRRADGHNEASSIISDTVVLTSAAKIGFNIQGIANTGVNVAVPVAQSSMRIVRMKD